MILLFRSAQPARWLRVVGVLLALVGSSPAWAQAAPKRPTVKTGSWPPMPTPWYFVDAQRADSAALSALNPSNIASIQVLKGAAARALNTAARGRGIIVITTRQNDQNAKVVAFNQQVEQILKAHQPPSEATIRAENAEQPADVRYYLNGTASTKAAVDKLDSHTVTGVRTLQDKRAAEYAHDAGAAEVFLITTRP